MTKSILTVAMCATLLWAGTVPAKDKDEQANKQCNAQLASCQVARDKCTNTDLPACTSDLSTCNTNAATCTADLAQCQSQSGASKVLTSPALYLNPTNPTDQLLCLVTNISTTTVSADVAFVDGTGSTTYCGVTPITLTPGAGQAVGCPPNPNNFSSYCRITITSSGDAAVRGNHCLVDALDNVKFCSEAR